MIIVFKYIVEIYFNYRNKFNILIIVLFKLVVIVFWSFGMYKKN